MDDFCDIITLFLIIFFTAEANKTSSSDSSLEDEENFLELTAAPKDDNNMKSEL